MQVIQTASFQVRRDALEQCVSAIREFVTYVQKNEPGTLEYVSLQQPDDPTRFLHYIIFRDEAADEIHSTSAAVKRFQAALYPQLLAPVEFTQYQLAAKAERVR